MTLTLETIRDCLEGGVPSTVATCSADGIPNATYITQAHFVDASHVALSFQFFNKTHQNVLANPHAEIAVLDPTTGARYNLEADYVRTETAGPLFETMKAKLAGIASHVGMTGVFRLQGADVYRVLGITRVSRDELAAPAPRTDLLSAVRAAIERMPQCADIATLLDGTLESLQARLEISHSMIVLLDAPGERLYTVASRGYAQSGVGSEIPLGWGVIGVAAAHRTPIRIPYAAAEYSYGRAIRDSAIRAGLPPTIETAIPFPGLHDTRSQIAVPIGADATLLGVLFAESPTESRFGYRDEDALAAIAGALGLALRGLQDAPDQADSAPGGAGVPSQASPVPRGEVVTVRHYAQDDSVFIDEDYLIKGVAGAILRKLLRDHRDAQRLEFTNRELRLDASLRLPDLSDNLEARLLLLQRRLVERSSPIRIERVGRGRIRLNLQRPVALVEIPSNRRAERR